MAAATLENDRIASRRFVRNLALSLTGGAVLTLVGAVAAHADEAGTDSSGTAGTGTGDATAVGNRSGTATGQTLAPSGGGGGTTVVTQTAVVPNVGVAIANTGGNVAVGNASVNQAAGTQTATGAGIASSNSGEVYNASDGSAWITTGEASAVGNESTTTIGQSASGTLGILTAQTTFVANGGVAIANTGINAAIGNVSQNQTGLLQTATNPFGLASNSGRASNGSDGQATVGTGAASATGNRSATTLLQTAGGAGDGDPGGLLVINQAGVVANLGLGLANTGGNLAIGNASQNTHPLNLQVASVDPTVGTLFAIVSNSSDVSNDSGGEASIRTGDAWAIGNDANTNLTQTTTGDPDALGAIVNTQVAGALNAGVGVANTGINAAIGNASTNLVATQQTTDVGAPNVSSPLVTASNSVTVTSSSDGTAEIETGDATATGNSSASSTHITQDATGEVAGSGVVVNTQVAAVANVGLGVANSGGNLAVGNRSDNALSTLQVAAVFGNPGADADVIGPLTLSNALNGSNTSDGTASIDTGDAKATGNESDTWVSQSADGTITEGSMGVVPNVQAAVVVNAGAGIANTGVNAAIGNASGRAVAPNDARGQQLAAILPGGNDLTIVGPVTLSNSLSLSNASDGTAEVGTGDAWARGNSSYTEVNQDLDATVDGMGVPVAPQLAIVANLGLGVANSGVNAAIGNASTNSANTTLQTSAFNPPNDVVVLGPVTVTNQSETGNASDGAACVCTGSATASGNISRTVVSQDVDITVDDGVSIVPTVGLVINAGLGLANSGINAAIGNLSTNTATADQIADLPAAIPPVLVGPQTITNGGGATNQSSGLGEVGTGNATAIGNESTTEMAQAATVDGAGVVAPLIATTANLGLGLANAGVNLGVGNASTNVASVAQRAEGTGTVANQGTARNESDGTGQIGDPNCDDDKIEEPSQPGAPGLPRTGNELDAQTLAALMLLLAGFGLTEVSRRQRTAPS